MSFNFSYANRENENMFNQAGNSLSEYNFNYDF